MRRGIISKSRGRVMAALLAVVAMSAFAQDPGDGGGTVIGTIEAGGRTAAGAQRLQLKGKDYVFTSTPFIDYRGGATAGLDALRPGVRVRLQLKRGGGQPVIERIEILPD